MVSEGDPFGWHRLTSYGDHKKAVEMSSASLRLKVVLEA